MENFAKRLQDSRKKASMTQQEVAESLGIGYSTYRHYEYGNSVPIFTDVVKMAKLFHVSLDYLGGLTDDPTPRDEVHSI